MLIPRGNERGLTFDLFVMLTNGDEDFVPPRRTVERSTECNPAPIYCGRLNDTYPDAKPMGYPFDRLPHSNVRNLDGFVHGIPNMRYVQV
jgi:tyrosinase